MTESQKKDESTPRAEVDVTTDVLTPGEVAAWQAALDRKLPITEADLRALLAAAAEFPDPRTFMAEGGLGGNQSANRVADAPGGLAVG